MKPASFEEREYEAPLYNQLERGPSPVWSPGQVLEGRIGIDRGLFLADWAVWEALGYDHVPRGAVLSRIHWPRWWGPRPPARPLPTFRLNLFIQAKRPYHSARPPQRTKRYGFVGPTWAFYTDQRQQRLLDTLARKTRPRAVVLYAAPVFHLTRDLYRHISNRSIVTNSTFPASEELSGHTTWYYQAPGATGVANQEPRFVQAPGLGDRLSAFLGSVADLPADETLSGLWKMIIEVSTDPLLQDDPAMARFANARLQLDRLLDGVSLEQPLREWAEITIFCEMLALLWFLVGEKPTLAA